MPIAWARSVEWLQASAHELGTPLNVVAGRAALIASGRLPAEEVTSSALTIKSEADRITSIVRQMLDFARQRRPQTNRCELRPLIERTLNLVSSLADKRQVQIEFVDAPHDADQSPPPLIATIDEAQIQQVLTNLIVNALQATPSGGRVQVTLDRIDKDSPSSNAPSQPASAWLRMAVDDSGPGVPLEIRERIFEPFFTTKDVGEGTGLGLSIAYGILQEHNGQLIVTDSALGGARFEVWLPDSPSTTVQE